MIKKIIVALLASQVGVGAYLYVREAQQEKVLEIPKLSSRALAPASAPAGHFATWESPFTNPTLDNYDPRDMRQALPTYEGVAGAPINSVSINQSLAVPMGQVRVASATSRKTAKKKLRSAGGGSDMGSTTQSTSTSAGAATPSAGGTFAYRNFVALSSVSTSPMFSPKVPGTTRELPPPPNIVIENKVLPIGDGLAILLLLVLFYAIRRKY